MARRLWVRARVRVRARVWVRVRVTGRATVSIRVGVRWESDLQISGFLRRVPSPLHGTSHTLGLGRGSQLARGTDEDINRARTVGWG